MDACLRVVVVVGVGVHMRACACVWGAGCGLGWGGKFTRSVVLLTTSVKVAKTRTSGTSGTTATTHRPAYSDGDTTVTSSFIRIK
jgi:nitrogen fixation protein FixH